MSGAHDHQHSSSRQLTLSLVFTTGFAVVEAVGGWLSGSLALLSDAGHMITDSSALGVGAIAAWVAAKPPSRKHSFGWQRAEVIGALANTLFMLAVVVAIAIAAVDRLQSPQPVSSIPVMVVAAIGLLINIAVAWILSRGEKTLNTRGAMIHVMGDLLGSVAALAAGLVIYLTGWTPIDPILSFFISALILVSSLRLLRQTLHVLMEGVPDDLDLGRVGYAMASVQGVREVHDLHVWALSSNAYSLSAHVTIESLDDWPDIHARLEEQLERDFGLSHITLQPEIRPRAKALHPDNIEYS